MIRWARTLAIAVVLGSPLPLATAARADECPPLDPTCIVETVQDTVEQTAGTAQDEVEGTLGTVQDAVNETVDSLGHGGDPGNGPGDEPGGNGGKDLGGRGGGKEGHRARQERPGTRERASLAASLHRAPVTGILTSTGEIEGTTPFAHQPERPSLQHVIGHALIGTAGSVVILVVSIALMLGFLGIQGRLDRRDPKLAMSRPDRDLVPFA